MMAPEPASEKQRHYLCGLLKARGVRQEDSPSLILTVFPQGLTKQEASAEIDQTKYMSGLPARWIHAYVRQLRKRHAIPIAALLEHLQVAFDGAMQPAGLSRLQQQDLIAWLCHPDRRTPSDQSQAT
jgi:hypothetical protein